MSDTEINETFDLDDRRAEIVPALRKPNKANFSDTQIGSVSTSTSFVQLNQLLDHCVSKITFTAAIDLEANGVNNTNNVRNNEKKPDPPKSDPIQKAMGSLGRWHVIVCGFIFLLKFPVAWHQMSIIFMAPKINATCVNSSIINECSADCNAYEYKRDIFTETIQMTWNLVCNRKHLANLSQTIFMFGILVGNMVFGTLADKFGRRGPLVIAVFIQLISGIATAFVPWFWLFCVLRFVTAFATGGTMVTSFVLVMELVGTSWRELISVLYQIPFNLGHLTLPMFAYFFRDWRHLQLALSLPSLILISYYWIIPESPRWLFTVGRTDESAAVLEKVAKFNKRPTETIKMDLDKYAIATNTNVKEVARGNFLDLFRTPNMRSKTLCMCFNWLVCGMCFFGVAQYIGESDGDIFKNVMVSAALEIPGTILCIYTMKKFGRKWTLIFSNTITGICMLLIAYKPLIQVELASIALVGMSVSFPTVYLYAGELFPTVVRNVGVGTASMIARIGSMVAPFIITLKYISHIYPPIVFGIVPILGAALVLLLPETQGQPLPATIEDGENFGKKPKK
ncbi:organic cation transporter protein isoform X2 [Contarinia nasturtii]|uniref:organic cation transporter protein isoform X2 n=1 Tax=Contarinia nasturtii TaxID=265458 RepID=UPI0012D400AA|nr:organic cation transporter protein isoform X2 [Contarinia nasturtii]